MREYKIWFGMKGRCLNSNHTEYHNYGGRGIKVCERWLDFINFYEDMGECTGNLSLDRVDVNGNYEKSNCRWATVREQILSRRDVTLYWWEGCKVLLQELCELVGVNYRTVMTRRRRGLPLSFTFGFEPEVAKQAEMVKHWSKLKYEEL